MWTFHENKQKERKPLESHDSDCGERKQDVTYRSVDVSWRAMSTS
jgi:hypothetical protein